MQNHKKMGRILSIVLCMAMLLSLFSVQVFADKATFAPPTAAMSVDSKIITAAAHSQGYITPEVLGINNTTSRATELPAGFSKNAEATTGTFTLNSAQRMAVLGVFGSDINEAANPYLYNYFYNCYATEKDQELAPFGTYTLSKDIGGGPNGAAISGGYDQNGQTVPASLYLRPDILIGIAPAKMADGKTIAYNDKINELPENNDTDPDNDYEPYQIDYVMVHVYSFLQTLYELSDTIDEIKADTGKTTRYGNPQIISGDVEKYVKGLESYVLKQLKKDGTKPLTVAVVDTSYTKKLRDSGSLQDGQYVVNTKDCSTQATTGYSRVGEFAADTTTNIVDAIGGLELHKDDEANGFANNYYIVTADQIADYADVVLFCDVLSSIPENSGNNAVTQFRQDLASNVSKGKDVDGIEMMTVAFDCVGSIGANSVENLLGMAYYTAYLYPQYLNQFDVAAYWYQNFYHISDLTKLKQVMATNFSDSSVQSAYAKQYSPSVPDYSKEAVEKKLSEFKAKADILSNWSSVDYSKL